MAAWDEVGKFWGARTMRERRVLAAGGTLLLLALLIATLVEPAARNIARLKTQLPQLRVQAAQLDALIAESAALRRLPAAGTPGGTEARAALDRSLAEAGFGGTRLEAVPGGDLHLTFSNVAYAKWAAWLAGAERTLGARAASVRVRNGAANAPGSADIELTLRLPRA